MSTPQDPDPVGPPQTPGWQQPPDYGPAGYGAPGYGAPGYGPPPGYGAPGYAAPPGYGPGYPPVGYSRPTNTLAILALVFAFVFAPAGLVMGIVARKQINRTGEEGSGLALAGIIVGGIFSAIWVLMIIFWIIALTAISTGSFGP
jgi:hypothetical protein